MSQFRFANPGWLLIDLCFLFAVLWSIRSESRSAILFSSVALVRDLPRTMAQRVRRLLPWVRFAGLTLVVVALARPQLGLQEFRLRTEGISIVMCLDRSGSMLAMDFQDEGKRINRLDAVKRVFRQFVVGGDELAGRPDDLIGLVSFGGFAEARSPLTLDHAALVEVLDSVAIAQPIYDKQGAVINEAYLSEERQTAIGDALALAVDRLRKSESKSRVVILLSDGENTAGVIEPQEAAQLAKNFGIKIYAIGVGSTGVAPFPGKDAFGRSVLVRQNVILDEKTLRSLAETTGGEYFNARDSEALAEVYRQIDKLEKSVSEGRLYTQYRELFQWWLLPGLALILVEFAARRFRFQRIP